MSGTSLARAYGKTSCRPNAAADNTAAVSRANSAPLTLTDSKSHAEPFHDHTHDRRTNEYALDSYAHISDMHQR